MKTSTAGLSLCYAKDAMCAKAGLKELEEMTTVVTKVVDLIAARA
jgi:hypothetical protein